MAAQVNVTPPQPFVVVPIVESGMSVSIVESGPAIVEISTIVPPTSADSRFKHVQSTVSDTWTIFHALQKEPSVTVKDGSGKNTEGHVEWPDINTVIIYFSAPLSGVAYLN